MNRTTTSVLAAAVTLCCITSAIARQRPDYRGPSQPTSTTMSPIVCIRAPCNPGGPYPRPNTWPYPRPFWPVGCLAC
jgi:hypothetical protein